MSLKRGREDWQQYHGGICPGAFGEQLQGLSLRLYEEKKTHQTNLLTKYDCPPRYGRLSIVDKILDGVQFNLEMEASSPAVIYDKNDRTYKKVESERVEWLEAFCKTDQCLQTKDGVLKKASTVTSEESIDAEGAADEDRFVVKERAKKRRKLTRELREFTGVPSEGKKKHKGWSDEGMMTFEKYVKAIKKDVADDKYVAWEKAYWEVMKRLGHTRKERDEPLQQARYKPSLSVVYEGF
jgi:hypothetical protein